MLVLQAFEQQGVLLPVAVFFQALHQFFTPVLHQVGALVFDPEGGLQCTEAAVGKIESHLYHSLFFRGEDGGVEIGLLLVEKPFQNIFLPVGRCHQHQAEY